MEGEVPPKLKAGLSSFKEGAVEVSDLGLLANELGVARGDWTLEVSKDDFGAAAPKEKPVLAGEPTLVGVDLLRLKGVLATSLAGGDLTVLPKVKPPGLAFAGLVLNPPEKGVPAALA